MAIRASDLALTPLSPDWLAAKELPNTIRVLQSLEPPHGIVVGRPIPPLTVLVYAAIRFEFVKTFTNPVGLRGHRFGLRVINIIDG